MMLAIDKHTNFLGWPMGSNVWTLEHCTAVPRLFENECRLYNYTCHGLWLLCLHQTCYFLAFNVIVRAF